MKPSRGILVWSALAACAVMVIGAMTWLTRGVLAAERDRMRAEQERIVAENRADLEERTRLALWRMDALGAAIMLRENRHAAMDYLGPAFEHRPVEPEVLLHFHMHQGQPLTTPEFLGVDMPGQSTVDLKFPERRERVKRLREFLAANPLPGDAWTQLNCAAAMGESQWNAVSKSAPLEQSYNTQQRLNKKGEELRKDETYQMYSNVTEQAQRAKAVANSFTQADQMAVPQQSGIIEIMRAADVGQMRAVWLAGELFLLRQATWYRDSAGNGMAQGQSSSVQGVWMDSQKLREQLLREVADLLPSAKLLPVEGNRAAADPLALVSFPFRLERNEVLAAASLAIKPAFGAPLWVAWSAAGLAVLSSSLLVRGVMRLSERRASFVSAVTHELRTPLTTFRLYSDMLESGAVKPEKRGDYLRVLSREADRLAHLVENVLSFSKIERGSARSAIRETTVGDLLEPMRDRLEARLATAGLAFEMDSACSHRVRVDTAAIEHILFNLIDNAAKYASAGDPPKVAIRTKSAERAVEIIVTDHGPGIPVSERRRIFRAFHKSAREAAESRPGVGLGLALSRRLAKSLGGGLECVDSEKGACFVLSLPRI